jgi:ornithine carbamoyltransferase
VTRHLLRLAGLEAGELLGLLDLARRLRDEPEVHAGALSGRCVALLLEKPSLRTRFSIEAAVARLGGRVLLAADAETGLGSREPIPDAARVLSRYVDAVAIRTFAQARVEELAEWSTVPVVNALTDEHHPLQALADLMTLAAAHAGGDPAGLRGLRLAYVGDGNNVAHSLIEGCALAGVEIACACPPGFEPDPAVVAWARERGAAVDLSASPEKAVAGAAAVYTDVWTSMGQEAEAARRREAFAGFQVTRDLMALAGPGAIFLHCLPAHRGEEVAAEVMDGPASRVFDQAENRMHTAGAVLLTLMGAS